MLGAGVLLFGLVVAYQASTVTVGFSYAVVGPRLLPMAVSAGLIVTGAAILAGALLRRTKSDPAEPYDWGPVVLISCGMLLQMLLVVPLGWIPVTGVSFAVAAWAFGSRRPLLNLAVGLCVAAVTFAIFNYGLGLRLPAGSIARSLGLFG